MRHLTSTSHEHSKVHLSYKAIGWAFLKVEILDLSSLQKYSYLRITGVV